MEIGATGGGQGANDPTDRRPDGAGRNGREILLGRTPDHRSAALAVLRAAPGTRFTPEEVVEKLGGDVPVSLGAARHVLDELVIDGEALRVEGDQGPVYLLARGPAPGTAASRPATAVPAPQPRQKHGWADAGRPAVPSWTGREALRRLLRGRHA